MGNYHGCYVNHAVQCSSYFQDAMTCNYEQFSFDERRSKIETNCWTNTDRVGKVIVLPIVLVFFAVILIALFLKWKKLDEIRKSKTVVGVDPNYAITHGRYAAGADDWTFDRDMLPYLMPDIWRNCCITDPAPLRIMFTLIVSCLLIALIFIPLGMSTRNHDSEQDSTSDPYSLTSVGWILLILTVPFGCLACCLRSCCGVWRGERERKWQELQQAENGRVGAGPVQEYAIHVNAIPMVQISQQPPQPYPQQQPQSFAAISSHAPIQYEQPNAYAQQVEGMNGLSTTTSDPQEGNQQHQVAINIDSTPSESTDASAPAHAPPPPQYSTNDEPLE